MILYMLKFLTSVLTLILYGETPNECLKHDTIYGEIPNECLTHDTIYVETPNECFNTRYYIW